MQRKKIRIVCEEFIVLKNCQNCFTVYYHPYEPLCSSCRKEAEEQVKLVRDFLRQYPGSSMIDTANGTGLSRETLRALIRQGKINRR